MRLTALSLALCVCLPIGCGGDDDAPGADAGGGGVCASNEDCSDGMFCSGEEQCNPANPAANARGCLPGAPPCLASQTCDEAGARCASDCGTSPDADGDGVESIDCGGSDCDDADENRFPGNPEICDDDDEDCDSGTIGDRDADMDGEVDAMCCNTNSAGDRICGTDCDDSQASANPSAPEVCDAIDNDCDGSTDEGFECPPGMMRACSVCGRTGEGMQTCDSATCSWEPCTAAEACNACDDDSDGSIDEDFMCQRGDATTCMNSCGTMSTGNCNMMCDGVDSCIAPEECNYCDDDGDMTFHDELSLAMIDDSGVLACAPTMVLPSFMVSVQGGRCTVVSGNRQRADVLATGARADSGAITFSVPMGYGPLDVHVEASWLKRTSTGSTGGWSIVVIAAGTLRRVAASPGYDRSMVTRGIAAEWAWNGTATDSLRLVRLNGTAAGVMIRPAAAPGTFSRSYNAENGVAVLQSLNLRYTPELDNTPAREGNATLSHDSPLPPNNVTQNIRVQASGTTLMDELQPGDMLTVAAVAGESPSRTTGSFQLGYEGVARSISYVSSETLCFAYP